MTSWLKFGPIFMHQLPKLLLASAGFSFATVTIAAPPELPKELVLSGDNIISVTVNGRPTRLEVRPDDAGLLTLNPAIAAELGLKPGMIGLRTRVGPVIVTGNSAVHNVDFGGGPKSKRILWADRDSSSAADGVISPASMPYERVVFQLRPAAGTEKIYRHPLDRFGFLGRGGIGTTLKIRDEKVVVAFSLLQDENLASAPTGNWLAENFDGAFTGDAKSTLIYYGVERPTRAMTLKQQLPLGDLKLSEIAVRVRDYGNAEGIADAAATPADEASANSDEIVVTGKKNKNADLRLTVGREMLKNCSTLTYDFGKDEIRLSCAL